MKQTRLSICIPTYNFGAFIGRTLDSIARQASVGVEVVIVDGASTDNTFQVVRDIQQSHPWIRYHRREANMGVDRDLAKAVELADGEYCWLMSSDDVMAPIALERVLKELQSGFDIYLCNRTECDRNLAPTRRRPWLSSSGDEVWSFGSELDLLRYCQNARSLGALFSYISSIIVRRERWNTVKYDQRFDGSHYAHAFRLLRILLDNGRLKYIQEPLVLCRGGNDSFAAHGMLQRIALDLDGYERLATIFENARVREAFKAVMRREHAWYGLGQLKLGIQEAGIWDAFEQKLLSYGYTRQQLQIAKLLAKVPGILTAGRITRSILEKYRLNGVSRKTRNDTISDDDSCATRRSLLCI
jgi:abequosyltransferase